jgi:hypothetical protein
VEPPDRLWLGKIVNIPASKMQCHLILGRNRAVVPIDLKVFQLLS